MFQRLCSAGVIYGKLEFQFSRLKVLHWSDSSINSTKRDSLACFLNICPELSELFIDVSCLPLVEFHLISDDKP